MDSKIIKIFNGKAYNELYLNAEEISAIQAESEKYRIAELTRPRTIEEGTLELNRAILAEKLADSTDKTLAIACMAFFEPWTNGVYAVGDVRTDPTTGYPYECILAHDSTVNTTWDVTVRTLWKPYHSTKKEYALPWETPTGAHDMYKAGEYMIWTDYEIYKCLSATAYSPADYAVAWEKQ